MLLRMIDLALALPKLKPSTEIGASIGKRSCNDDGVRIARSEEIVAPNCQRVPVTETDMIRLDDAQRMFTDSRRMCRFLARNACRSVRFELFGELDKHVMKGIADDVRGEPTALLRLRE